MNIFATELTAGQAFTTKYNKLTALAAPIADKFSANGGYKVLVTDGAEEFWHLFGAADMVAAN